jgi:hypothetical protein
MDAFQQRYGIEEDRQVRNYHRNRRMFAIRNNKLFIADQGADFSHADWFNKLGWISESNDEEMASITRGAVEPTGVFFYVGYNFEVTDIAETEMLRYLSELVTALDVPLTGHLYGGKIIDLPGSKGRHRQDYGDIGRLLQRTSLT